MTHPKPTTKIKLSEYQECVLLREYLDLLMVQEKIINYTHIPNSTYTPSWGQKVKNKQMGLRPGFPDYIIIAGDPGSTQAFCIEMKIDKGGVLSPEQKIWIRDLTNANIPAYVAHGFDEAKEIVDRYI